MTPGEIADIFVRMEQRLVRSLKRNLAAHKAEEEREGAQWPAWQAEKLRSLRRYRADTRMVIDQAVADVSEETERLLREEYEAGAAQTDIEAREAGVAVVSGPPQFLGVDAPRLDNLIAEINSSMHDAGSAALRLTDDVYRRTISRVELELAAGSLTLDQAIDAAVRDFLAAGVNCIEYSDGRRVNIASYAEMALRTAATRSYLRGEADRRREYGVDTVLVSQYGACSDTCLPWQGRVYIDDVWGSFEGPTSGDRGRSRNGRWYPLLSVAVAAGLLHPNCRHTLSTWFEGISRLPPPMDAGRVREAARLEQRQRQLERRVRRYKRLAEGTQDAGKARACRRKARQAQADLREYIDNHGDVLRRDPRREKIYPPERPVASGQKSGILKSVNTDPLPITDDAIRRVPLVKPEALDDAGARALQEAHRDLLRSLQDAEPGTEAIAYYGMDMQLLETHRGGMWQVRGSRIGRPHIAMHNHPSGETFSTDDVSRFIFDADEVIMSVAGNNGRVYMIEKLDDFDAAGYYHYLNQAEKDDPDRGKTPDNIVKFMRRVLKEAGQYGYRYTERL